MNSVDRINSIDSHLLGYQILTEDYPALLDWAERARKLFSFWYGEPTKEKVGDFDTLAAWKLLAELPEE